MFSVANKISNKDFFLGLNSISNPEDGVANDVRYHLPCWVKAKKEAQRIERVVTTDKEENIGQILSDIEILNLIECELNDPSKKVLDMNTVNTIYKELLRENGTEENDIKDNYKRYLKELIESNIINVKFIKNKNPSKPEHICSTDTNVEAFDVTMKKTENVNDILHVAKIIRKELTEHTRWKFKGTFTLPPLLNKLVQWILIGPRKNIQNISRRDSAENVTSIVTQMIYQSFKTRRQVNYEPKTETSRVMTSNIETPLNVGLGLYMHQKTRSKNLCNFLSGLNLSVNYDKVRNVKSNLAISVIKRTKDNGGVYKPSSILEGNPAFFAIDNSDLQIDTPDGKDQLHATATAIYQQHDLDIPNIPFVKIERELKPGKNKELIYTIKFCPEPKRENKSYNPFKDMLNFEEIKKSKESGIVWFLMKLDVLNQLMKYSRVLNTRRGLHFQVGGGWVGTFHNI